MNKVFKLSLAALSLSSCAFAANTVTQTFTLGQTNESFSQAFAFSQFNATLGNLTSIHFTINGSEVGNATVTNGNTKSGTYTYNNQADLYVTSPLGVVYNETLPGTNQSATIGAGASKNFTGVSASSTADAEYTGSGVGTFTLTTYTGNGAAAATISSATFIGPGTVNFFLNGDNVSGCSGASVSCSTTGTGGGTVSLFYDYTPAVVNNTPEPATMGLLGSALIGLGFLKIRRKKA